MVAKNIFKYSKHKNILVHFLVFKKDRIEMNYS